MAIDAFPEVTEADESGLLAVGGDLEVPSLVLAYSNGIFPWPIEDSELIPWFAPPERAVLFLNEFRISRSLQKVVRHAGFRLHIDRNCPEVIRRCAASARKGQRGTWIREDMLAAYVRLHHAGHCHSVECYREERLVGGLYGVSIGKMFAGESMFFEEANASKFAFVGLVEHLRRQGVDWLDCQTLTPLLASFGAREISRAEFQTLLRAAIHAPVRVFASTSAATVRPK